MIRVSPRPRIFGGELSVSVRESQEFLRIGVRTPQADMSAVRTSLTQTSVAVSAATASSRTPSRSFDVAAVLATTHT